MYRSMKSGLLLFAIVVGLAVNSVVVQAQDRADPGSNEPYSPALVHYRLGIYYQIKGDHPRAISEFNLTIDGLPLLGYAYAARGDSYAALGEYETAIADYTQAIQIFPDYVSALYTRGRAYATLGETTLAVADYTNAIGQMPEYPNPYWGLGDLFFDAGDYAQALDNYQHYLARETEPDALVMTRVETLQVAA